VTALERYEIDNEQSHQSPSQVFGVGTKGEVLGVDYDLCNWVWHIPEAKDLRLRNEIWNGIEKGEMKKEELERVVGKITHYSPLIKNGKFNRSWLLKLNKRKLAKEEIIRISPGARRQLCWWAAALARCAAGASIPDIREWALIEGIVLHSDAAGGGRGAGFGGVAVDTPSKNSMAWTQEVWPEWLNEEKESPYGDILGQKLTWMEGIASLAMLSVMTKEVQGNTVYLHVDNAGKPVTEQ